MSLPVKLHKNRKTSHITAQLQINRTVLSEYHNLLVELQEPEASDFWKSHPGYRTKGAVYFMEFFSSVISTALVIPVTGA